ncbi:MAG: hypothetical protein L0214_01860, partial [candidate division NC10 bacterium]|nr:hypothetical protein [candidate division NC10 bacterium]
AMVKITGAQLKEPEQDILHNRVTSALVYKMASDRLATRPSPGTLGGQRHMIQGPIRGSAYRMVPLALALIVAVLLGGACDGLPRGEAQTREGAHSRAEELLGALRKGDWSMAARFVYLDGNTRARMGIAGGAAREDAVPKIEAWFKTIYGTVRPGSVHSVTIDPSEPPRARVQYRHGDFDALTMRFVDGNWYYVVE